MSRKRCVRRVWEKLNPIEHAIARAAKLSPAEIKVQEDALRPALNNMTRGQWTGSDINKVCDAANRVEILMQHQRVNDPHFLLEVGLVLSAIQQRQQELGTLALRANEIEVIRWVVESYLSILTEITSGRFADACREVDTKVAKIQAERRNRGKTINETQAATARP